MLRLASYDIVFQEIPGEVTLALNISGCPNNCRGCHSPHLRGDVGEILDDGLMSGLLHRYGDSVTCVCFMGGDGDPSEVQRLSEFIRSETAGRLKTGWYSGKPSLPQSVNGDNFDYIKLGPYVEKLGGLDSESTNQRLYKIEGREWRDITSMFLKK